MSGRRAVAGAVLLDLAVSPLFVWDVFTGALGRELDVGEVSLSVVFSLGLVAFTGGVLVGGRLADSVPARTLAMVTGAGTVSGLLGSAVAPSVPVLVVTFGILLGGATGLGYATAVRLAGTVSTRRGLTLGVVVSAYALGSVVLAPLATWLLVEIGRAWTFVVLAGVLGVCLLGAIALVPGAAEVPQDRQRARVAEPVRRASRSIIGLWLTFSLGSAPALAAFAHAGDLSGSGRAAVLAVPLLSVGNLVGRLVAGPLSDRIGRVPALHGNCALLVLACLPLAVGASAGAALVALLLLGTQYGALSALAPAATSDTVPREVFGTTYGLVFTGWGVAGLVAPVATASAAAVVGFDGAYQGALVVAVLAWLAVGLYRG